MNTSQPINEMQPNNWKHLDQIIVASQIDINGKYKKGVKEHGGNLANKGLQFFASEMRAEAIDQMVYTHCVMADLLKIKFMVEDILQSSESLYTQEKCKEILVVFNGTDKDLK